MEQGCQPSQRFSRLRVGWLCKTANRFKYWLKRLKFIIEFIRWIRQRLSIKQQLQYFNSNTPFSSESVR